MGQGSSQPPLPNSETGSNDRLESWKEVAAYLKREVRTVQRWEKKEGLPIHRLQHDKLGSIYAYKSELDTWWKERRPQIESQPESAESEDVEPEETSAPAIPARRTTSPLSAANRAGVGLAFIILLVVTIYVLWKSTRIKPDRSEKIMVMVLPFKNLSGDPEQDSFCDGFTEELITQLSRMQPETIGVIARTTSTIYKETSKSIGEIGREVGADYIVEGSVRRQGNRVRITPQLIQVSDQAHRWADDFDRELEDVLRVQSEVALAAAKVMQITLSPQTQRRLASTPRVNPEAHDAYLKGWELTNTRTPQGLAEGVQYFRKAIQLDPNYAPYHAGLANALNMQAFYSFVSPPKVNPDARTAALRAIQLDDTVAEAHSALANLQYEYEYDWPAAEKSFQRMEVLNPSYASGLAWYADFLALEGKTKESIVQILRAEKLDPFSVAIATDVALSYYYARDFDKAIEQCRKIIARTPSYALAHFWLGRALLTKGNHAEAIRELQEAIRVQPGNLLAIAVLGNAYGVAGQPAEAQRIILQLGDIGRTQYVTPALYSIIYLGLKDHEQALNWADVAFKEHAGLLTRLKMDPIADGLHGNPRYQKLLNKLGFPPGTNK